MTDDTARRPRVLVPITIHFSVRYVVRTGLLARMRAFCEPVLALSWDDDDLAADLRTEGVDVVRLPDAEVDGRVHGLIRTLDAGFTRRLGSPSTAIDRRRQHVDQPLEVRARRWATWKRAQLQDLRPGTEDQARAALPGALAAGTNIDAFAAFLRDEDVDVVFSVTPFSVQELLLLHAAEAAGLRQITSILSFDNITTRPPLPVIFDRYLVWNEANARELLRGYPGLTRDEIAVVGPAQFDFYADPSRVRPEAEWRASIDLPEGVPTVLYGAGPPSVSPHEAQYVDHLLAAIGGALPEDLHVVLRRHPNDLPDRWERFRSHPSVRFDDPGALGSHAYRPGQVNLRDQQISDLCSTLAHTDVHVNVSSTMTLDGAFYGKPQIGPAYDDEGGRRQRRRAIELYEREHFLEIVDSGGLELARSRTELVQLVGRALSEPERLAPQRQVMLEALCSRTDGHATERVAAELEGFLRTDA
ncbi:MAG TPA: hypothetical protein VNS19_05000 [Acidimicrobiales bacterium]|nr:hypothetical protein [Acidimicrobiales bacterium]